MAPKLRSSTIAKRKMTSSTKSRKTKKQKIEKVCSFWDLPSLLRLPLLKKLDAVSLTRLRCSNKALNHLVEETALITRSDQQLVISVDLSLKESPLSFLTTRDECVDFRRCTSDSSELKESIFIEIEDPQQELAGVHFKTIVVDICVDDLMDAPPFWKLFKKRAMPTLKALKPHCDALVFTWTDDYGDVAPVLEYVTFTSLFFEDCEIDATKMNFNVMHGNVINIKTLETNDVAAAFGTLCQFKHGIFEIEDNDGTVVPQLIKAVHELPLGKLEKLNVTVLSEPHVHADEDGNVKSGQEEKEDDDDGEDEPVEDEDDAPDEDDEDDWEDNEPFDDDDECDPRNLSRLAIVSTIRARTSKGRAVRNKFYKIPVRGGGYAIISKTWTCIYDDLIWTDFTFYIYPNYTKEKLFEAFFDQTFKLWDLADGLKSPQFREFLESSSEQEAMKKACKDKTKLKAWLQENAKAPAVFK